MSDKGKTEDKPAKATRSIADFPHADQIDATADLSGIIYADVINPHPDLVYRFVTHDKLGQWKSRGFQDSPPGADGKAVQVRGPQPDVVPVACHRSVAVARDKARKERSLELQQKVKRVASDGTEKTVARHGTGDLRRAPQQE